jgi:hypothetical protein
MSQHGTIRRYTLIIEKVERNQYPSFQEIKDYLFDSGFEVSTLTAIFTKKSHIFLGCH